MFVWVALASLCVSPDRAVANSRYASIVVDMDADAVIRERRADVSLHPASLTKMMTLYLVFEAVEAGRLRMDQTLTVSRAAAAQPPSSIGLRRGDQITVRQAIEASAVKSANDAAVALAEAVSGSERAFARLMTRKARELGMTRTRFYNASGLTHRRHKSTARDMSVLARRLFRDHQRFYPIFSTRSFRWDGRRYRATNRRLLNGYEGTDGIKTGYTRAAGFNVAASARRDGRRILVVVFGGRSSRSRDRHVRQLADAAFERLGPLNVAIPRLRPDGPAAAVAAQMAPRPNPRRHGIAVASAPASTLSRGLTALGDALVPTASAAPAPQRRAWRGALTPSPAQSPRRVGRWAVQVGAYNRAPQAQRRLEAVSALRVAQLSRATAAIQAPTGRSRIHRARFVGLSESQARGACAALVRRGEDCLALALR